MIIAGRDLSVILFRPFANSAQFNRVLASGIVLRSPLAQREFVPREWSLSGIFSAACVLNRDDLLFIQAPRELVPTP